jgi:16S rRNA (uracil1498-N3)-methyltransferase
MSATPRLHLAQNLSQGLTVALSEDQSHYLARVLRLVPGGAVRVFNSRSGEFAAVVAEVGKRQVQLRLGALQRPAYQTPDLWLLFAPLKKARTDFVVEKAVELGVREIRPVLTERTDPQVVRIERLQRIAEEAAEQTERLDVPEIREAVRLEAALTAWDAARALWFCDEAGDEPEASWGGDVGRASPAVDALGVAAAPAAVLVGPEGGFSPGERERLRKLRAETAAVAALTLWQALAGDWRTSE